MTKTARLSNPAHPEYGEATIPFPIPPDEYAHVIEMMEQLEIGHVLDRDCKVQDMTDWPPVLDRLCGQCINIDELDYLAKRLESFDKNELAQFQGTVFEHDLHDMTDLINQTFCCQEATVVTDFSDLERIGKRHYLTLHGGCPSAELDNVDGVETTYLLLDGGGGKVTPFGVVFDNMMQMEKLYDGVYFPDYSYTTPQLLVEMITPDKPGKSTWLNLPMPEQQLDRLIARGNAQDFNYDLTNYQLPPCVMDVVEFRPSSVYALNDLCAAMSVLDQREFFKLESVIDFSQPESPEQLTQLIRNLDLFDYVPDVKGTEELGRYMIQESGHFDYDENLDEFYDYKAYGMQKMHSEDGCFVVGGYIAYRGTLTLDELMDGDPAEQYQKEQGMDMGGMT